MFNIERENDSKWRKTAFLAVKEFSTFLRGIKSQNPGGFCCFNCPHSFATKNKFESHKESFDNKDCCNVVMPSEDIRT